MLSTALDEEGKKKKIMTPEKSVFLSQIPTKSVCHQQQQPKEEKKKKHMPPKKIISSSQTSSSSVEEILPAQQSNGETLPTSSSSYSSSSTIKTTTMTPTTTTSPELLAYTSSLQQILTNSQAKDKLIQLYLDGNKQERLTITQMYPQAFRNPEFVQCLIKAGTIRIAQTIEKEFDSSSSSFAENGERKSLKSYFGSMNESNISTSSSSASASTVPQRRSRGDNDNEESYESDQHEGGGEQRQRQGNSSSSSSTSTNNNSNNDNNAKRELQQRCRTLRKQIDSVVSSVVGAGPHKIRFGVARTQSDCDKIISLFNQQFVYPGVRELRGTHVKPPQKVSTRHRTIRTGNFCWFIQYVKTGEICCAACVNIHPVVEGYDDRVVFEIPLYATAAGFKNLGLARLLNAAIQELAIFMKAELILISADQNAIPFWTNKNLGGGGGYSRLTRSQMDAISFLYKNQCQLFGDVTLLGWIPPRGADALASGLLQDALDKSPKFVLDGAARLPLV